LDGTGHANLGGNRNGNLDGVRHIHTYLVGDIDIDRIGDIDGVLHIVGGVYYDSLGHDVHARDRDRDGAGHANIDDDLDRDGLVPRDVRAEGDRVRANGGCATGSHSIGRQDTLGA
jgi:hypothetical protein